MLILPKLVGFKIEPPVRDKELWAIGLVVVEWAFLENDLDSWASCANGGKLLRREEGNPYGFKETVRFIKERVEALGVEPPKSEFIDILVTILGVQAERDKIVHRMWNTGPPGRPEQLTVSAIKKGGGWDDWRLDATKMVDVARKIDDLRARLYQLILKHGEIKKGSLRQERAWQRICGKQDPP